MAMRNIWNEVDIEVEVDKIIGDIPTDMLEEELEERKQVAKENPERANRDESNRSSIIDYSIDPNDYELMGQDKAEISDFHESDMMNELDKRGYKVLQKNDERLIGGVVTIDALAGYLRDIQNWKLKDFLCDVLCITHLSSKEDITEAIKNVI